MRKIKVPVTVALAGWILALIMSVARADGPDAHETTAHETTALEATDEHETPKQAHLRYWFGLGPTLTTTSGYDFAADRYPGKTYGGLAIGAGFDALLGSERQFSPGVRIVFPWINETSQGARGYGAGHVTRISLLPGFGYALIPHRLEARILAGISYIRGESPEFDAKLAVTPGLSLSWQLSDSARGSIYQGIELGAYRIEETRGSADGGLYSGLCSGLNTAFGGTAPDPSCTRGIAPTAYVFTLLYKLGGQH